MVDVDEAISLVHGLGKMVPCETDGSKQIYKVGEDCLHCLKRLTALVNNEMRYTSELDEGHDPVPRELYHLLSQWKVVQKNLLPLYSCAAGNRKLSTSVLKLLLALTLAPHPKSFDLSSQNATLQSYREAFISHNAIHILVAELQLLMSSRLSVFTSPSVDQESNCVDGAAKGIVSAPELLSSHECRYVEMILTLLVNLLRVPSNNFTSAMMSNRALWNALIEQFKESNVFEILVIIITTNCYRLQQFRQKKVRPQKIHGTSDTLALSREEQASEKKPEHDTETNTPEQDNEENVAPPSSTENVGGEAENPETIDAGDSFEEDDVVIIEDVEENERLQDDVENGSDEEDEGEGEGEGEEEEEAETQDEGDNENEDVEEEDPNRENAALVHRWNLLILEIMVLLYGYEDMEDVIKACGKSAVTLDSTSCREEHESNGSKRSRLKEILESEELENPTAARGIQSMVGGYNSHSDLRQYLAHSRHTNFGGTFTLNDKRPDTGVQRTICSMETFFAKDGIPESEKPPRMNRKSFRVMDPISQTSVKAKRILAEFMEHYLRVCNELYLAELSRELLRIGMLSQESMLEASVEMDCQQLDVVHFLCLLRTVVQFTRCAQAGQKELKLDFIAEIFREEIFELAFHRAAEYRLHKLWRPLHITVSLLKELFLVICLVQENSHALPLRTAMTKLSSQVLYRKENVDLVFDLLKSVELHYNTLGYVSELVQLAHLMIKSVEHMSKQGHLFVKRLRKATKQELLQQKRQERIAVSSAKQSEPHSPAQAKNQDKTSEEFLAFRARASQGWVDSTPAPPPPPSHDDLFAEGQAEGRDEDTAERLESHQQTLTEEDEEDDMLAESMVEEETAISFEGYILGFVHPKILQIYLELLRNYRHNTPTANCCVAKMVTRISAQLHMVPVFFQLGFLAVFEELLLDKVSASRHRELYRVALHVTKEFFRMVRVKPAVALYSLFWISRWDAASLVAEVDPTVQATLYAPNSPTAAPRSSAKQATGMSSEINLGRIENVDEGEPEFDFAPATPQATSKSDMTDPEVDPLQPENTNPVPQKQKQHKLPLSSQKVNEVKKLQKSIRQMEKLRQIEQENRKLLTMDPEGEIDYEDVDGLARILARHKRALLHPSTTTTGILSV